MKELLTPHEVADRYRVSQWTVTRWIREGRLTAINVGTEKRATWRIPENKLPPEGLTEESR